MRLKINYLNIVVLLVMFFCVLVSISEAQESGVTELTVIYSNEPIVVDILFAKELLEPDLAGFRIYKREISAGEVYDLDNISSAWIHVPYNSGVTEYTVLAPALEPTDMKDTVFGFVGTPYDNETPPLQADPSEEAILTIDVTEDGQPPGGLIYFRIRVVPEE